LLILKWKKHKRTHFTGKKRSSESLSKKRLKALKMVIGASQRERQNIGETEASETAER
jgi:hypothetical protein